MKTNIPPVPSTAKAREELHRLLQRGRGLPNKGPVESLLYDFDQAVQHIRELRETIHGDTCQIEADCLPACQNASDWLLERDCREGRTDES